MSWEATAYVKKLRECPDGAPLETEHKLILFCLADCHSCHKRMSWPSLKLLADDALTSLSTLKRALDYLEVHCVIEQHRPEHQGRGQLCWYEFLEIDAPAKLAVKLHRLAKGVQAEPLFSPGESSSEGVQIQSERGSEGVQIEVRNKEVEQGTCREQVTQRAPRASEPVLISKAEAERRIVRAATEFARRNAARRVSWPSLCQQSEVRELIALHWPQLRDVAAVEFEFGPKVRRALAN